jgi:hypothetical protein
MQHGNASTKKPFKITFYTSRKMPAFPAYCRQGLWLYLGLRMPCAHLLYIIEYHVYLLTIYSNWFVKGK